MSYYDDQDDDDGYAEDDEQSQESRVWQLLLLINPGDEDGALAQFTAYREAAAPYGEELADPLEVVAEAIDWRAGFRVEQADTPALVQALDELVARWNLDLDWGGDPDEEEFHQERDAAELLATAYDGLAEHGYSLWLWETSDDRVAGWITLRRDAEPMRELAALLGINLRQGDQLG